MRHIVLIAVFVTCAPALAHHAAPVGRATTAPGLGVGVPAGIGWPRQTRLDVSWAYDFVRLGNMRQDSRRYRDESQAGFTLQTLTTTALLRLGAGQSARLSLPVGYVRFLTPQGQGDGGVGLGDVQLTLGQSVAALLGGDLAFDVRVNAGMMFPSGVYTRANAVSVSRVSSGADGSVNLVTYHTRATLGGGLFAATGSLEVLWQATSRFALNTSWLLVSPVTSTPDDLMWGRDMRFGLASSVAVVSGFQIVVGADYLHHGRDTVPQERTGQKLRVGGRQSAGVSLGVQLDGVLPVTCFVQSHLPVWQDARGVQLMESYAVSLGCGGGVSL